MIEISEEAITNLTKEETAHLNLMRKEYNLDEATFSSTQRFYRELRKLNSSVSKSIMLPDLMKVALIIAETSISMWNVKGERIRGPIISLLQAVKNNPIEVAKGLKLFQEKSKLAIDTVDDFFILASEIEFGYKYAVKIESMINSMNFEGRFDQTYEKTYKAFAWVLFLDSAKQMKLINFEEKDLYEKKETLLDFKEELRFETESENKHSKELNYLSVSILYVMIMRSFEFFRPKCFEYDGKEPKLNKSLISKIYSELFNRFNIEDIKLYKEIANKLDIYLETLLTKNILLSAEFLTLETIYRNYRRINRNYDLNEFDEKNKNQIDMRVFLKATTPLKHPKLLTPRHQLNLPSQRILNYDAIENNVKYVSMLPETLPEVLPKKLPVLPYYNTISKKTPLICASVLTTNIEFIHYLNNQGHYFETKENHFELNFTFLHIMLSKMKDVKFHERHIEQITLLIKKYSMEYPHCTSESIITIAVEIIFYISFGLDDNRFLISCEMLPEIEMFKALFSILKSEIPRTLYLHLNYFLSFLIKDRIWNSDRILNQLKENNKENIMNEEDKNLYTEPIDSKVMNAMVESIEIYIESLIKTLCEREEIQTEAIKYVKEMTFRYPYLLKNRHLDVFVLCSIYIAEKTKQTEFSFNGLIQLYSRITTQEEFKKVVVEIEEADVKITIIDFYNTSFVPAFRRAFNMSAKYKNNRNIELSNESIREEDAIIEESIEHYYYSEDENEESVEEKETYLNGENLTNSLKISPKNEIQRQHSTYILSKETVFDEHRHETTLRTRPPLVKECSDTHQTKKNAYK